MLSRDIYLLIGPPGSGKGTLSALCAKELGWQQLSTGNLCRKYSTMGTSLGNEIDFILKAGKLIPDGIIISMVMEWLASDEVKDVPIVLDGFPRTVAQARSLYQELTAIGLVTNIRVIELKVDEKVLMQRLLARYICSAEGCQMIYSAIPSSVFKPLSAMKCDVCSAPLVRRSDDSEGPIVERLTIYRHHMFALTDFYKKVGIPVKTLDAQVPFEDLFDDFKNVVTSYAS